MTTNTRDNELPARLLLAERDTLLPLLRTRPETDFTLPTKGCPDWTVREVLAHCSSALMRVVDRRFEKGVFSPESNDRDIADRADWPMARILDELERGMTEAGRAIVRAGGPLDGVALGEWVHAGDVREALAEPDAYAGPALPDALTLLARITRERDHIPLRADVDGFGEPLVLGREGYGKPPAQFKGSGAALVRLYTGRTPEGLPYELVGARAEQLNIFG